MSDKAPAEQDFSDNLSIQRVLLETSASKPTIEISSTTTGIDIFEHLDKPYLTAALAYVDQEDIIGSLDNLLITNLVLIFIIIASLSTNLVANFIPAQYTLINLIPSSLSLKISSLIISIFGFLIKKPRCTFTQGF